DTCILGWTLDDDATDRSVFQLLLQISTYLQIFAEHRRKVAVTSIPARTPVTRNRKTETGWMYLLSHRDSLVTDSHVNVTGLFRDTITTTLGTRSEALEDRALFDIDRFHEQFVDIGTVVVLGIGDSGFEHLLDNRSAFFRAELQNVQSSIDFLATDQIGDQTAFLIRQAYAFEDSFSFHYFLAFLSAA